MSTNSQLYRLKDITVVPQAKDLIDIVLSKTQRKTPTQVHPQYDIRRIRSFYMRKIKFAQQTFHDKLTSIIEEFPRLDEIHPFYADLCNVFYDRDHYKLALGQISSMRNALDSMAKDYVRLVKYADSPYKCKLLKKAALGRMCSAVKKLQKCLSYLEEVRRHLGRLPGINPFTQTLLLAGFPNVGKSTFMNALSRANVEVADWAFTTKAPYVGHFDYSYRRWQIVDTPGLLDRPLSSRNTIELTAITALAHLFAVVLFFVDISGGCGHTVEEQVALFRSLNPLLQKKPVVIALNKIDVRKPEDLTAIEKAAIESMVADRPAELTRFVTCSAEIGLNLDQAKVTACDMLEAWQKERSKLAGNTQLEPFISDVIQSPDRLPFIPDQLMTDNIKKSVGSDGDVFETTKARIEAMGGAGVYNPDDRESWQLQNSLWNYDKIPELYEGKLIGDFIDPDIEAKLDKLMAEETELEAAWAQAPQVVSSDWKSAKDALAEISIQRETRRLASRLKKKSNNARRERKVIDVKEMAEKLSKLGMDPSKVKKSLKERKVEDTQVSAKKISKLMSSLMAPADTAISTETSVSLSNVAGMQDEASRSGSSSTKDHLKKSMKDKLSAFSLVRKPGTTGIIAKRALMPTSRSDKSVGGKSWLMAKADKINQRVLKSFSKPKKGQPKDQICESDRFIGTKKPKHLYSGKRSMGKTDRR